MTTPTLSIIVARSRNGVIGVNGDLPWRLPGDLAYFKAVTLGKPVLMGRVTWESLPFPLPGRPNLVLSRDVNYAARGAELFASVKDMVGRGYELAGEQGGEEVMVIGGAQLYARLLPWVDRVYLTEVDTLIEGDAHFPALSGADWQITEERGPLQGPKDSLPYTLRTYERKRP